jgi:hypothetical protein
VTPLAVAESLLDDGLREIEGFRMQQLQAVQSDSEIVPFTTDGCSGNLSANWGGLADSLPGFADEFGDKPPWEDCCVAHDKDYWSGSVIDGYSSRLNADQELRQCVVDTGARLTPELSARYSVTDENVDRAFSVVADLMYKAVRLGGQPCSLLPWRWGYGWPNCAFAKASGISSGYSDIKSDEHVVFFNTSGWLNPENTHWHIPVHAWIYEPADSLLRKGIFASLLESSYELKVTTETEAVFSQRTNLLIADNERGKRLVIRFAGRDIVLPESKENGHVYTTLKLPLDVINAVSEQGRVHYFAVTRPDDNRRFEGDVQLVSGQGVSVISDIDDTIKTSNVTDHKLLFENTFFKDFREVSGMPELYRRLSAGGAKIHFVSSSPWQLYRPLLDFIDGAGFPWATLNLKAIRFRDETLFNLFKKGTETKPEQIEPILQRYPQRKFILIGDSGEQDPEVYGDIARRYPAQIQRILIRNVDARIEQDERYKTAFKNVARNKWQLFDYPEQLAADDLLGVE